MTTAIVTGCLGALGQAICSELATGHYEIIGIDRLDQPDFKWGRYYKCDLSDTQQISTVLETIRGKTSDIALLVNNAAYYKPIKLFETDIEEFDYSQAVNVRAVFQLSQEVARWMITDQCRGSIVNISSIAGKIGSPVIAYGTSKAAVIGLTKSMSLALAPHGIRVNTIAPSTFTSPMSAAIEPSRAQQYLSNISMGRAGEPHEIAKVVRFLGGSDSSYMTGTTVDVAGGWIS